ncbi:MAG: hypothetical protein LAO78_08050 [Acidobacteriia bacterium]|nr:hypothetical protein [Terriglobia bacterium]
MSALNLLVFRGGQRHASGQELKTALAERLRQLGSRCSQDAVIGALLLAGELEGGMADADDESARPVEVLTDRIADALLLGEAVSDFEILGRAARGVPIREQLSISTPEGFAYYALHPLAYAEVLSHVSLSTNNLIIVGIRSIGTTLSAVTAAAARFHGMQVQRITVRPQGHPYNRHTELLPRLLAIVQKAVSSGATFAIVDEGPGLSGSSFLSVAEALERAGAPRERVVLLSSYQPNVDMLCASDAASRWRRYQNVAVAAEARRPAHAVDFIGGGRWRSRLLNELEWPAAWTSFERLKYLSSMDHASADHSSTEHGEPRFYKFAGLGRYGDQVFEREQKVAAAGFGPHPRWESDGFVSYPWCSCQRASDSGMNSRPMSASDLSQSVLERLAEYCAFRVRALAVSLSDLNALQQMAQHNLRELGLDAPVDLRLEHPVIADGRMQPHEWLLMKDGQMLKTDSGSHGDDHFFPGPTDIAWDLAGAIVEWRMDQQQAREFLDSYRRKSGDNASGRVDNFLKVYAVFRAAYSMMAANALRGTEEQARLDRAAAGYEDFLMQLESRSLTAV